MVRKEVLGDSHLLVNLRHISGPIEQNFEDRKPCRIGQDGKFVGAVVRCPCEFHNTSSEDHHLTLQPELKSSPVEF